MAALKAAVGQCRQSKPVIGVQHAHEHGERPRQSEIRQHQARQLHGDGHPRTADDETRREDGHDDRHGKRKQERQSSERDGERADELSRVSASGGFPALIARTQIERHHRGVHRAFGEQAADEIRKLKSNEERVRPHARSEYGGNHHVAAKTENARQEGDTPYRRDVACK